MAIKFLGVDPLGLKPSKILFKGDNDAEVMYKIAGNNVKVSFVYSSKTEHNFGIRGLNRIDTFQNIKLSNNDEIIKEMSWQVEKKYNKEGYTHKGKVDLYENLHDLCGYLTCYPSDAEADLPSLTGESSAYNMIFAAACALRHKIEENKERFNRLKENVSHKNPEPNPLDSGLNVNPPKTKSSRDL
ncbi:MAG: hypothetical protein IJS26_04370 [Alphaproteobacteria bacterium]|nr:hypothetical protein [Alphaproteobacteria bacterium]